MRIFIVISFLSGILLKDPLKNLLKKIFIKTVNLYHTNINYSKDSSNQQPKIFLVCKITDQLLFNEKFPKTLNGPRVQPSWDFYEQKGIIKIELNTTISKNIGYTDFLKEIDEDLDIPFFESFSELTFFIHYFIDNKEYINVYPKDSFIEIEDFNLNKTELLKRYQNTICASLNYNTNTEYITKYFKMFLNNKTVLKTEMLLLNYDKIDTPLTNIIKLELVNSKSIIISSLNDYL